MEYLVIADIEIDGAKVVQYTNITLQQKFNAHHELILRINYDVLEATGSFGLENAKKKIGKPILLKLQQVTQNKELAYEFRGIICEVRIEQSGNSNPDLVFVGYSPTILIENGQHLTSFYKNDLKKIVQQVTKPIDDAGYKINVSPQYTKQLAYICQYKESGFHFINRLSSDFSEFFYYDGKELHFGKPSSTKSVEVIYGEDISSLQLTLQAQAMKFSNYSYLSKDDKVETYDAPSSVDGLGKYGNYVLNESDKLFAEPVNMPVKQRVEKKADLENFVKKQKAAIAANLEILTGTSYNPKVAIGSVIDVKLSKAKNNSFVKEDYGKFLVTSVEHRVSEKGKYYNVFEAVPSEVEVLAVPNVIVPIAEPQVAIVKDNNDPSGSGRIRVQMLWQQKDNLMTDWLRVMTPDAGTSGEFSKNRGFVFIPEPGDQVLVCFRYNDADRPFVLGSIFHGKSGGGGGSTNKIKSLATRSGHIIELNDMDGGEMITIRDKKKNTIIVDTVKNTITVKTNDIINIEAKNVVNVKSDKEVNVKTSVANVTADNVNVKATDSVNVKAADSINMDAGSINMSAGSISMIASAAITMNAGGALEGAAGGAVTFGAGGSASLVSGRDTVILAAKTLSATGGKNVKVGAGSGASLELDTKGDAKLNSSKKVDVSSKEAIITGTDKATVKSEKTVVEGSSKAVVKGSQVEIS